MPAWLSELIPVAPWLAALGLVMWALVRAWPHVRKAMHFVDDVVGEPERPGHPPRAGLMEMVAKLQHEVMPNTGTSLRDGVDRTEEHIAILTEQLADLTKTVDQAIAWQKKHEKKSDAVVARVTALEQKGKTS